MISLAKMVPDSVHPNLPNVGSDEPKVSKEVSDAFLSVLVDVETADAQSERRPKDTDALAIILDDCCVPDGRNLSGGNFSYSSTVIDKDIPQIAPEDLRAEMHDSVLHIVKQTHPDNTTLSAPTYGLADNQTETPGEVIGAADAKPDQLALSTLPALHAQTAAHLRTDMPGIADKPVAAILSGSSGHMGQEHSSEPTRQKMPDTPEESQRSEVTMTLVRSGSDAKSAMFPIQDGATAHKALQTLMPSGTATESPPTLHLSTQAQSEILPPAIPARSSQSPTHTIVQTQALSMAPIQDALVKAHLSEKGVVMRLDPPEMGRVYIEFEFGSGKHVSAILRTELPEAGLLLREQLVSLQSFLQDRGFDSVKLDVTSQGFAERDSDPSQSETGHWDDIHNEPAGIDVAEIHPLDRKIGSSNTRHADALDITL